jgi:hypothetical protein
VGHFQPAHVTALSYPWRTITGMAMYEPSSDEFWARVVDEARCSEFDGLDGRCQLVRGHPEQHLLQRDGRRYGWPVGAQVIRPPWTPGGFPRDE